MTTVSLLKKKLSNGMLSLYLSYYPYIIRPSTGKKSRREFLRLYVYENPKSKKEQKHNDETNAIADIIFSKRKVQLFNKEYGFEENTRLRISFVEFFENIVIDRYNTNLNYASFYSAFSHFKYFTKGNDVMTSDIDAEMIKNFRKFLLKTKSLKGNRPLSTNSASSYYKCFASVLKSAAQENLIDKGLLDTIEFIKEEETFREYLNEEELKRLWNTPCPNDQLKRAAFFSVFTGLRYSDIAALRWEMIISDKHQGHYINLNIQKTKAKDKLPIALEAYNLLLLEGKSIGKIFKGMNYGTIQKGLLNWIAASGINKHITFHSFRHTYATLQLANGTDIYTVSKLLGHKSINTTQIYAKVIDRTKIESTTKIKLGIDELQ